ncbi:hypothetical protein HI914_06668 [Erysiphe necator]|nr:hypothetical protein HI914_06668 [Erysiphe necator]
MKNNIFECIPSRIYFEQLLRQVVQSIDYRVSLSLDHNLPPLLKIIYAFVKEWFRKEHQGVSVPRYPELIKPPVPSCKTQGKKNGANS